MVLRSLARFIEEYTKSRITQYIEELRELCSVDTYSYHKLGLDELALMLATRLRGLGMKVSIIEREEWGNDIYGVLHGDGEGNILVLGHTDTVYPAGIATERPLCMQDGLIYGPGVCDMKGGILLAIYAIEALQAAGYHSFGEVRFVCVSDEEITDRHSKDLLEKVCRDCNAVFVLEAGRANGNIVSARKGVAWYTLTARGRSAHAGVEPEKGRNAIDELFHQALQFRSLNGWCEGVTINTGVISGGTLPNVVPDFAQAHFDLRFLRNHDRFATEQRWRTMMRHQLVSGVELTLEATPDFREPMECNSKTLELANIAQEIAGMLMFEAKHVSTGGGSDANYVSGYGVPVLDGLGPVGGLDHSPNEYIEEKSIAPRTALLAGLIASTGMNQNGCVAKMAKMQ